MYSQYLQKTIIRKTKDFTLLTAEAVVQRCSVKKVFLKISQNPHEKTSQGLF